MTKRQRRQKRHKQSEGPSISSIQLEHFSNEFPLEIDEIRKLEPLKSHCAPEIFLLTLSDIVYLAKRRLDPDTGCTIWLGIQAAQDASEKIELALRGLMSLDIERMELTFQFAGEFPHPLLQTPDANKIFEHLRDTSALLLILSAAMRLGSGGPQKARGRGRPSSPYVEPTLELIQLWESICTIPFADGSDFEFIRRIPTPKKLSVPKAKGQRFMSKQPSTEFIHLSLQMINPKIKDSEVLTAIKSALELRDKYYDFVTHKPPGGTLLDIAKQFQQFSVGRTCQSRRTRAPTSPLKLIEPFLLDEDDI
jgi:hypothetical protein